MKSTCYIHLAVAVTSLLTSACSNPGSRAEPARGAETAAQSPSTNATNATLLIDREIDALWKQARVTPAPDASDSEFLRRVTLDVAGRTPTPAEVTSFLADTSPAKREALVDRLLSSDEYAQHWAQLYADAVVGRSVRIRRRYPPSTIEWFEAAFREGMPMDQMARELITARGPLVENGAVGYVVGNRLRGGSLETLAGDTARFFLGLKIQCAQCHDHPTDKRWKKADFAQFAAFFGEVTLKKAEKKSLAYVASDVNFGFQGKPEARIPARQVTPRFLGTDVHPARDELRRDTLARLLPKSPLFARAAVGRTWDQLFGRGIVDPWDDLGAEDDPRQPALLIHLADEFAKNGFNHRWLVKAIIMSKAYGRASRGGSPADPTKLEAVFARASVRPLTADQLFSSLMLVTGTDASSDRRMQRWKNEDRKNRELRQYLLTFDDEEGEESDVFSGSITQALLLRNGALTNSGSRVLEGMALGRILGKSKDPSKRLEWMFLTCFARLPEAGERAQLLDYLATAASGNRTYENLFHAMITSTEFTTNH